MAAMVGPAVPLGYDSGLALDSTGILDAPLPPLEEIEFFQSMIAEDFGGDAVLQGQEMLGLEFDYVHLHNPRESSFVGGQSVSGTAASDAVRSPLGGRETSHSTNNQPTLRVGNESIAGGSSRSPGTNSLILTPASTLLEYNPSNSDSNFLEDDEADDNLSPTSTVQTDSDYVHVRSCYNDARRSFPSPQMSNINNNRPPPSSSGASGLSDAQQASRASSVAASTASVSGGQWGLFSTTNSAFMDNQQHHAANDLSQLFSVSSSYAPGDFTSAGQPYSDTVLSDPSAIDTTMFDTTIPYRSTHDHQMLAQNPFVTNSQLAQGYPHPQIQQYGQANAFMQQHPHAQQLAAQQARMRDASGASFRPQLAIPSTDSLIVQQQPELRTAPMHMQQPRMTPSPIHAVSSVSRRSVPTIPSARASPYPQPAARPIPPTSTAQQVRRQRQAPAPVLHSTPAAAGPSSRQLQTLAKARPPPIVPSNAAPPLSEVAKGRRGGRQKNSHLPDQARKKSSKMRQLGVCWRCVIQRDPCDEGTPCGRCMMKSQKGQTHFFDCDRSKLPGFVHDFLPLQASMTLMHQKQTIEDCVNDQVLEWDMQNPMDVYLTSGYGPPLRWKLYEFKARTPELLGQFQYLQDPTTGVSQRFHKYSPPFGLIKLDSGDDRHFDDYLEQCLSPEFLEDLGWSCFEEECQVDSDMFQAKLLVLITKLYEDTTDYDLRSLLRQIIRMMIITYIMGHTLTICEDTLPNVLSSVKHPPSRPPPGQRPLQHTSPRLANRQLKFFFAILRTNIYEKILHWQQQTLHGSKPPIEVTWLPAFCAMLGFAMVLEEVQRTILIQADAKAAKGEMSFEAADTEARNACERIDNRFQLLVGLFQCKYRSKKWNNNGSFGPATPEFRDLKTREFLADLRQLVREKYDHLRSRRDVSFSRENQCRYTSRLVARFLLPFLNLPGN